MSSEKGFLLLEHHLLFVALLSYPIALFFPIYSNEIGGKWRKAPSSDQVQNSKRKKMRKTERTTERDSNRYSPTPTPDHSSVRTITEGTPSIADEHRTFSPNIPNIFYRTKNLDERYNEEILESNQTVSLKQIHG